MPEIFHELVEFSILASQIDPFDPMEKAMRGPWRAISGKTEHLHQNWTLVHEYPLSKELLSPLSCLEITGRCTTMLLPQKAPLRPLRICVTLTDNATKNLTRHISAMAEEGLRVLGCGQACFEAIASAR